MGGRGEQRMLNLLPRVLGKGTRGVLRKEEFFLSSHWVGDGDGAAESTFGRRRVLV